jgi:hypothetical protein
MTDVGAYLDAHPEWCRLDRNPYWVETPIMNVLLGRSFFGVKIVYPFAPRADA